MSSEQFSPVLTCFGADGSMYVFAAEADGSWTIRRDGVVFWLGPGDHTSIDSATAQFLKLHRRDGNPAKSPPPPLTARDHA